jgi:hypothetical protein
MPKLIKLMSGKRFWNAVLACVLLRKSIRNGIPAHYATKIPLVKSIMKATVHMVR